MLLALIDVFHAVAWVSQLFYCVFKPILCLPWSKSLIDKPKCLTKQPCENIHSTNWLEVIGVGART